jgi:hypothetical protein
VRPDLTISNASLIGALGLALLALATSLGCKSDPRAQACASDRVELTSLVQQDKEIDKLLHQADLETSKGRGAEAATIITDRATPSAQKLIDKASAWTPASRWGQERRTELVALLRDRARSMVDYASALRSDDLRRVVDQLEAQRSLEQRALGLDRHLTDPQPVEACGPP